MQPVPSAEVVLSGQARSAGAGRRFISDALAAWGASEYEDTAQLLVSELVTNAILHARTDVTVRLDLSPARLRLEVTDASVRRPVTRRYSLEATTGRGLTLIDALAGRWGVESHHPGKTVWCELLAERPEERRRPEIEVDLAAFPDLEPGTAGSDSSAGPALMLRAA